MSNDRPGPQPYSEFFRRLRARPLSSWRVNDREATARAVAEELADLSFQREHASLATPAVPDLGAYALADQLEVLVNDAIDAGADPAPLVVRLAEQLSVRLH